MASVAVCWLLSSDQTRHKLSAGMMQKWVKAHHTGKVYFTNLGSEDACTKPGAIYDLYQSVFRLIVSCGSWMRNLNRVEQPNLLLFRPRLCPSSQRHCTLPSQRLFLVPAIIVVSQNICSNATYSKQKLVDQSGGNSSKNWTSPIYLHSFGLRLLTSSQTRDLCLIMMVACNET